MCLWSELVVVAETTFAPAISWKNAYYIRAYAAGYIFLRADMLADSNKPTTNGRLSSTPETSSGDAWLQPVRTLKCRLCFTINILSVLSDISAIAGGISQDITSIAPCEPWYWHILL
eukprot:scaffold281235_cov47-Prasinocladus_malaysianus.AAC.2